MIFNLASNARMLNQFFVLFDGRNRKGSKKLYLTLFEIFVLMLKITKIQQFEIL